MNVFQYFWYFFEGLLLAVWEMKTSKNVTEGNLVSVSLVFSQLNSLQYDIKGGIAHDGKKRMPVMGVPLKC